MTKDQELALSFLNLARYAQGMRNNIDRDDASTLFARMCYLEQRDHTFESLVVDWIRRCALLRRGEPTPAGTIDALMRELEQIAGIESVER